MLVVESRHRVQARRNYAEEWINHVTYVYFFISNDQEYNYSDAIITTHLPILM